jgi:hypothetical protein
MGKAMEGRRRRATAGLGAGARRYGPVEDIWCAWHEQSGPAQVNKPFRLLGSNEFNRTIERFVRVF